MANPFYQPLPGAIAFSVDTDGERFFSEVSNIIYQTDSLGLPVPLRRANMPEAFGPDVHPEVIQGLGNHIWYYVGSISEGTHATAFRLYWREPALGVTRAVIVPGEGELCARLVAELITHLQSTYGPALRMDKAKKADVSSAWQPRSEADRWFLTEYFIVHKEQRPPAYFKDEWVKRKQKEDSKFDPPNPGNNLWKLIGRWKRERDHQ